MQCAALLWAPLPCTQCPLWAHLPCAQRLVPQPRAPGCAGCIGTREGAGSAASFARKRHFVLAGHLASFTPQGSANTWLHARDLIRPRRPSTHGPRKPGTSATPTPSKSVPFRATHSTRLSAERSRPPHGGDSLDACHSAVRETILAEREQHARRSPFMCTDRPAMRVQPTATAMSQPGLGPEDQIVVPLTGGIAMIGEREPSIPGALPPSPIEPAPLSFYLLM